MFDFQKRSNFHRMEFHELDVMEMMDVMDSFDPSNPEDEVADSEGLLVVKHRQGWGQTGGSSQGEAGGQGGAGGQREAGGQGDSGEIPDDNYNDARPRVREEVRLPSSFGDSFGPSVREWTPLNEMGGLLAPVDELEEDEYTAEQDYQTIVSDLIHGR